MVFSTTNISTPSLFEKGDFPLVFYIRSTLGYWRRIEEVETAQ
tara:strand:- start:1739 stop:1867 length:129 start_codon:yes stop_codon:yes gene_type:complete